MKMSKQDSKGSIGIDERAEQQGEGSPFNSGVATTQRIHEVLSALNVCRANHPAVTLNALVGRVHALFQELAPFMSVKQRSDVAPLLNQLWGQLAKVGQGVSYQNDAHAITWELELKLREVAYQAGLTMPKGNSPAVAFRQGRG